MSVPADFALSEALRLAEHGYHLNPVTLTREASGMKRPRWSGLFFAAGGYVLGEEGHYRVLGELPHRSQLASTPDEVIALFAHAVRAERAGRPTGGRVVHHDLADVTRWIDEQRQPEHPSGARPA